jgi:serine/threonine protein kinase
MEQINSQKKSIENPIKFPPPKYNILMTEECKDFIRCCLNLDPTKRLGSKDDADEILNHPWFKGLD